MSFRDFAVFYRFNTGGFVSVPLRGNEFQSSILFNDEKIQELITVSVPLRGNEFQRFFTYIVAVSLVNVSVPLRGNEFQRIVLKFALDHRGKSFRPLTGK